MNNRVIFVFSAVVLAAVALSHQWVVSADALELKKAPTLEGTWRWNFVMPDGSTNRPKLKFFVDDGQLSAKTSFRPGAEIPVTNLLVSGDQVSFQVVRHRGDQNVVTSYRGRWNEEGIKGTIESNWAGDKQTFPWEASRAHHGVEGIWRWTNSFFSFGNRGGGRGPGGRGRGFESRVELEQEGEVITGRTVSSRGPAGSVAITNGVFTNGFIYFEIERTFFETRNLTKHFGKVSGDTITGTMESEVNGEDREIDWEATRVD